MRFFVLKKESLLIVLLLLSRKFKFKHPDNYRKKNPKHDRFQKEPIKKNSGIKL